jgi:hypothetical protein
MDEDEYYSLLKKLLALYLRIPWCTALRVTEAKRH